MYCLSDFYFIQIKALGAQDGFYQPFPLSTYYSYLKRFVLSPTTMGTIAPSSRWLCYKMLNKLNWQQDIQIAELGWVLG